MSANPTHADWEATTPNLGSPLQVGNRVLESIGRREALPALRSFSELHEQIRDRRMATGRAPDRDLFETERFILDEVLQLICDRAQAITLADGIVVALAEAEEEEKRQGPARSAGMVCRASSGPLAVARGVHLIGESELLQDCLESGRILHSDDCEIDARAELDFARAMESRSTVLVPFGGQRGPMGVLQAFSTAARAFSDHDVRCLDLFAELVLSALKPEEQDRRIDWLCGVTNEILRANPAAAPVVAEAAPIEVPQSVETGLVPSPVPATFSATEPDPPVALPIPEVIPELPVLAQLLVIPASLAEATGSGVADEPLEGESFTDESADEPLPDELPVSAEAARATAPFPVLPFLHRLSVPESSRPVLNVVMGLIAVAALFSAGAWWGMQVRGKTAGTSIVAANTAISPPSVTTPPAPPDVLSPAVSDNLTNPAQAGSNSNSSYDVRHLPPCRKRSWRHCRKSQVCVTGLRPSEARWSLTWTIRSPTKCIV